MFDTKKPQSLPRIGDKIIVLGAIVSQFPAKVSNVFYDPTTSRFQIDLDFGSMGKSRVYDHDENKTWRRIECHN